MDESRESKHQWMGAGMHLDQASEILRHMLMLALIISAPLLLVGLVVGVISSLIQSATQIQEQTLSFIPKLVAIIAAAIVLMPWITQRMVEYAKLVFSDGRLH